MHSTLGDHGGGTDEAYEAKAVEGVYKEVFFGGFWRFLRLKISCLEVFVYFRLSRSIPSWAFCLVFFFKCAFGSGSRWCFASPWLMLKFPTKRLLEQPSNLNGLQKSFLAWINWEVFQGDDVSPWKSGMAWIGCGSISVVRGASKAN